MISYEAINTNMLKKGNTWVDLGCGDYLHDSLDKLKEGRSFKKVIGVEAYQPAIDSRPESDIEFVNCDITDYVFPKNVDLITAIHSLEHITLTDATRLICKAKDIAKQVIIETPNEYEDGSGEVGRSGNPYQAHKCLIRPEYMEKLGFTQVLSYVQAKSTYTNSVYVWNKEGSHNIKRIT